VRETPNLGAAVILVAVLALSLTGCPVEEPRLLDAGEGDTSLHLVVTNQDLSREHVHLTIVLDGEDVATGDFAVEDQHRLYEFEVRVEAGRHELHIVSEHGEEHTAIINVPRERWVWIAHWGDAPDTYDIRVQDHPVRID
jgi:hypothetical protein